MKTRQEILSALEHVLTLETLPAPELAALSDALDLIRGLPAPPKPREHTPGPWKVTHDPKFKGQHPVHDPVHDHRYIVQDSARWEDYGDDDHRCEMLEGGIAICMMRDQFAQKEDAFLIAAAPDLLKACQTFLAVIEGAQALDWLDVPTAADEAARLARQAIARAIVAPTPPPIVNLEQLTRAAVATVAAITQEKKLQASRGQSVAAELAAAGQALSIALSGP